MRRFVPEERYKQHISMQGDLCWYCERPREVIDHYPAVSRIAEFPDMQGWLVASCERCNLFLTDSHQISLEARKHCVRNWLVEKTKIQWLFVFGYTLTQLQGITGWSITALRTVRNEHKRHKEKQLAALAANKAANDILTELSRIKHDR